MKLQVIKSSSRLALSLAFLLSLGTAACGMLGSETGDDSGSAASDETDVEAAVTSAIDSVNQTVNSSTSDSSASIATLVNGTAFSTTNAGASQLRRRFHCEDEDDYSEVFTCDPENNTSNRVVTFEDCEIEGSYRDVELNGTFTNTNTNAGADHCSEDSDVVDFSKLVMGTDSGDATHSHETGSDGLIFTFTNARGRDVTVVDTTSTTITYSDPVDADDDGSAETVSATINRTHHIEHTIGDVLAHDVDVFTTDTDFAAEDEDGADITVEVALPVHTLSFDDDGELETRTIESGNLIVDHNLAQVRLVFGVGDDGLTFNTQDGSCGPVSGTMTFTSYTINDDGSIGAELGTGSVTFEDGDVDAATFEGDALNLRPRPCN